MTKKNTQKVKMPFTASSVRVMESREWYKDRYRQVLNLTMVMAFCLILSVGLNGVLFFTKSPPRYFAATQDWRIKELEPLDKPIMSQGGLLTWTTTTISDTFSLDFLHWKKQLMDIKSNYFKDAFNELLQNMKSSGILVMVEDKRFNIKTVVESAPLITAEGMLNGAASWRIEFPLILSYESSRGVESTSRLQAQVLVQRVSTLDHPRGVKIKQVILKNKK